MDRYNYINRVELFPVYDMEERKLIAYAVAGHPYKEDWAERIALCLSACAGVSSEDLRGLRVTALLRSLADIKK